MVVLTKNEFTKLLEAAAHHQTAKEMAEIEEVVKGIRQGNIETFPAELVERLVLGEENPVRVFREYRGLAVKDLATAVGVSPQMISQIEGGRKSPALDTAKRIAAALKVTLDDLA
ncbi:helix-turn-helix transcriptional regulator [Sneathiella chinensis]|uniref:HTH cro/C1-type domain-containing protein n=2 Tax=Sneathiella chinensis TaxID=349750 RepID=A0ABQ5U7L2_9PROT|nr:helix-turn-helix transcriptional regulator [Sneathiella chinensis]GLQ07786.1 hypothetical protein GCM10007924_30070 [Sneathiella chinensis]